MSWLFKSLQTSEDSEPSSSGGDGSTSPENSRGGVKDELSIIGESIGRQLRGVAAFLVPPPSPPVPVASSDHVEELWPSDSFSQQALLGIRNDLVEIGGSVKSGLSRLSSNKAVAEISKLASNLLQFSDVDEGERGAKECVSEVDEFDEVPGITEEIVDFAKKISTRPEYWTDFPVSLDSDFEMSDAQREHASAVEHLVPGIASMKGIVSCADDEQFWLIYFVLLLPRLNRHDLQILATPKVLETTEMLLQKLQKKKREMAESTTSSMDDKTPQGSCSRQIESEVENKTTEGGRLKMDHEETAVESSEETRRNSAEEEDISFSDLEDNDDKLSDKPSSSRRNAEEEVQSSSPGGSSDWVQLNRSPGTRRPNLDSEGESSDWLAIDDSE